MYILYEIPFLIATFLFSDFRACAKFIFRFDAFADTTVGFYANICGAKGKSRDAGSWKKA